ncbi:MAG: PD-(D/E)XK nuclease family protein [Patescibacteria group bacterium]
MRTSFSALETFTQCPKKYEFQEIERLKVPKSKEAIFGTLVHAALKYMFSKDPVFPTEEEVVSYFRSSIAPSAIADNEKERFTALGEQLIRRFWKKNPPWTYNIIGLETRFEMPLRDAVGNEAHTLAGIIDRIDVLEDGSYEIIDYKTSRKLPSQDDVNNNLQLQIYRMSALKRWPQLTPERIQLSLYFLRAGEKLSVTSSALSPEETGRKVVETIQAIEKRTAEGAFPPRPSELCNWCGYKPFCPAWKHMYGKPGEQTSETPIDADALLKEYFELSDRMDTDETKLTQISEQLRAYMEDQKLTRLFSGSNVLAASEQTRTSYNITKVSEILAGTEFANLLLEPSEKKLKTILAKLPDALKNQIEAEAKIMKTFTTLRTSSLKPGMSDADTQQPEAAV